MDTWEDEARSEATFRYTVRNISKMKNLQLSPACYVRNLPWKMVIKSSHVWEIEPKRYFGFFLQCNEESESTSWSCYAVAELRLLSCKEGQEPFSKRIQHLFCSKWNNCGLSLFMAWQDVLNPDRGFIKNDSITLEVHIVADVPHGVNMSWDSKKHTGYVGLKNQDATCYMNSLLQTLYFINQLRKAVYKIPTKSDVPRERSALITLQRVFYKLQFSDKPVDIKETNFNFNFWEMLAFLNTPQYFLRMLLHELENEMIGTCVEDTVSKLFEGKIVSFIKCKNVDYKSTRIETFYDIQLNIKGKKNIYESFKDYMSTKNGEYSYYDVEKYGYELQQVKKRVIFSSFPPVLHLHLHFDNPVTDFSSVCKFNDRFEFYEKISLDKYLQNKETNADYTLHAVLVRCGDNHRGRYVVFINPAGDGKWYKFDDHVVSRCTKQEAIEHNYGGQDKDMSMTMSCTTTCMLVYIRNSELKNVLQEVKEEDIPREVRNVLQREFSQELSDLEREKRKKREKKEKNFHSLADALRKKSNMALPPPPEPYELDALYKENNMALPPPPEPHELDALCKGSNMVLPSPPEPRELDSFLKLVRFRLQKMSVETRFEIMQKILQLTYEVMN